MKITILASTFAFAILSPVIAHAQSEIIINPTAVLEAKGVAATISGTITCPIGISPFICADIRQRNGKNTIAGYGCSKAFVPCQNGPQPWTIAISAGNGFFKNGSAFAHASSGWCTDICEDVSMSRTITLK